MLARATSPPNSIISGSFWNCGAPPDSEMTVAIVNAPMTAPTKRRGERGEPVDRVRRPGERTDRPEDRQLTTAMNAELARLKPTLSRRLARDEDEGHARSDEQRQQVVVRGHEEEPDDGRELAQRERMALAPEVDVDDLRLGQEEGDREERPRDRQRGRDRRKPADEREIADGRRRCQRETEQPDPDRGGLGREARPHGPDDRIGRWMSVVHRWIVPCDARSGGYP